MKGHILFIIGLIPLVILMIYPGYSYAWGIAGWHTSIETEGSFTTFILLGILLMVTILYWLLDRICMFSNYLSLFHFIMTLLPTYYLIFGPKLIILFFDNDLEKVISTLGINFFLYSQFFSYIIPIVGQIIFVINIGMGLWKMIKVNRAVQ